MANFVPIQSEASRFGSQLGEVVQGLGQGLAAEHYSTKDVLKRLQNAKALQILENELGPEQAQALATFSEPTQLAVLKGGYGKLKEQPQLPQQLMQPAQQPAQAQTPFDPMAIYNRLAPQEKQLVDMFPKEFGHQFLKMMHDNEIQQLKQEQPRQRVEGGQRESGAQIQQPQMQQAPNAQAPQAQRVGFAESLKQPTALKPLEQEKHELAKEKLNLQKQTEARQFNKVYDDKLEKRVDSVNDLLPKAGEMKKLLEIPQTEEDAVDSGWSGLFWPRVSQNANSQRFSELGDDVAAALTALQGGAQTISRIKFNQQRKPRLGQHRQTQLERVNDMIHDGAIVRLEGDLRNWIASQNDGIEPRNIQSKIKPLWNELHNNIPDIPEGAQDGEILVDPKTKVRWKVEYPIMAFDGFEE